ncbi:MAG: hypothetical protein HYZ07_01805 [Candidatus Harrisonbacteria bacterium]|nr:hypothetical protein [Candidatus Harrisonbacteria bacterium]
MVTFLLIMGAVASLTPIMIQHFANPDHLTTSLGLTIVGSFGGYALVIYHCMRKSAARAFPWSLQVGIGMMVVSYIYVLTEVSRIAMNNPMPTIQ